MRVPVTDEVMDAETSPGLQDLIDFPHSQTLKSSCLVSTSTGELQEGSVSTVRMKQDREKHHRGKLATKWGKSRAVV